jgi:lipid II:glycine glycyltransferase (peptidoglycan interpeptide bridge formation enzyme)
VSTQLISGAEVAPVALAAVEYTAGDEWDALVAAHPRGQLLQRWAWGELKGAFGWRPLRLGIVASDDPRRVAAAQVLVRPFKGFSVCYVPRGPMFSGDAALDNALLHLLRRVARRRRAFFLRLEPSVLEGDPRADALHSRLQLAGYRVAPPLQPRTSMHLDLGPEPDRLFAAFSKGHRADVRRAERNGVSVRVGETAADLDSFYRIMEATTARANFGIHSRDYYRQAWELFGQDARLLIASRPDAGDVAAFLVFASGQEGQYMYSGSTAEGLKSGANHLLQWHAIRWVREHGCARYDLWGVPEELGAMLASPAEEREQIEEQAKAHPLYGAYRFKKGWGGDLVRYLPAYDQVYLAPAYWLWRRRTQAGDGA